MAHNLESVDGVTAFALRSEPAWHGLGTVFDKDTDITTAQMLALAKLDNWDVRLEPAPLPEGYNRNTDHQLVVRTSPFGLGTDVLSVVGERYRVYQNEDLFTFGDNILDGGAKWESAGSIKDGRQVFGSLVVPREFIIDPKGAADKTVTYLLVHTSHDGSAAIQAAITPVRVVCQNTLNIALDSKKQSFKMRHTLTVKDRVEDARKALSLTFSYMDDFQKEAQSLFETAVDAKKFNDIITALYPKPSVDETKKSGALTVWENKIDLLNDLYFTSPTNANIKGTAWGTFNALTERVDYFRQARRGSSEANTAAASGFDSQVNAEKNRIFQAVKALA
jgi:phage/plasmid-like protein (TIGR03299 family)